MTNWLSGQAILHEEQTGQRAGGVKATVPAVTVEDALRDSAVYDGDVEAQRSRAGHDLRLVLLEAAGDR